jgi:carbamate kinase
LDYGLQGKASERYVIALGGNALIPPGGRGTAEEQTRTVAEDADGVMAGERGTQVIAR